MSTKAIQEALRMLRDADGDSGANGGCIAAADEAEKELEAIRKACGDWDAGTEYGEVMTSDAMKAEELFQRIAKEAK